MAIEERDGGRPIPSGPLGYSVADDNDEVLIASRVRGDAYNRMEITVDGQVLTGAGTSRPLGTYVSRLGPTRVEVDAYPGATDDLQLTAALAAASEGSEIIFSPRVYSGLTARDFSGTLATLVGRGWHCGASDNWAQAHHLERNSVEGRFGCDRLSVTNCRRCARD